MTSNTNIKWYMTEAVVSALRNRKLAIVSDRDERTGATLNTAVDNGPYRALQRAYTAALHAAHVAEHLGVPHPVVADRLGTYVLPEMIAAAVVGAPYEWQDTRPLANAEKAVDEIEMAYGPIRRHVAA